MNMPVVKPGNVCIENARQPPTCKPDEAEDREGRRSEAEGAMHASNSNMATSISSSHVIAWEAPNLDGITSVLRPNAALMRRIWRRWLLACAFFCALICFLLVRMADAALLRLNTSISVKQPQQLTVTLGPLRSLAFAERTDHGRDAWASQYLHAVAQEQADEVKQLVEQLRKRRGSEGVEGIEQLLDEVLSPLLLDLRNALATGRMGAAREAALRGGALVEAADLDPPLGHTDLIVKVNFFLMARALLDDMQLARNTERFHTLAQTVLHQAPELAQRESLPRVQEHEPDAWDAYIDAKKALAQRKYQIAIQRFRDCAQDHSNPWLRDLALLGEGRAHYWQARNAAGKTVLKDVQKRLQDIAVELRSVSLRSDIVFYLDDLQARRP
jgi:hypothetical protein